MPQAATATATATPETLPKWMREQKNFEHKIQYVLHDASRFLTELRNGVALQAYAGAAGKFKPRLVGGGWGKTQAVSHEVRKNKAYVEANQALRQAKENLVIGDLNLSWDDAGIKNWAELRALHCKNIWESNIKAPLCRLMAMVTGYGLSWPCYDLFEHEGAVARVLTAKWWRRQGRVLQARTLDQMARQFGLVNGKGPQSYCSNEAVRRRRAQSKRNRATLEAMEATNEQGDCYTIAELAALSTSNPTNRRHELMVRIRGFEEVAEQTGRIGFFLTMTCPSAYHPIRHFTNKHGAIVRAVQNPKYIGADPRAAQAWQQKTWELCRAELDRKKIRLFGFRIVEPHYDGTPHWHALFFIEPERQQEFTEIVQRRWLREYADEEGAERVRTKIIPIDKERGSAAGYIAKYVCKNIDGSHIDADLLGKPAKNAAERICAWAATWGVRQFQQIGGPSVTVWRELRRLDPLDVMPAGGNKRQTKHLLKIEAMRQAVTEDSNWAAFFMMMGGPDTQKKYHPLKPAYWLETDEQGEISPELVNQQDGRALRGPVIPQGNITTFLDSPVNAYGEASKGRVFGLALAFTGGYLLSRVYRWTVKFIHHAMPLKSAESPPPGMAEKAASAQDLSDEALDWLRGPGALFESSGFNAGGLAPC